MMDSLKYFLFFILTMVSRLFGKNKIYNYAKNKKLKYKNILNYSKKSKIELDFFKAHMYFKQKYNINLPIDILGTGNIFILDKIKVGDIKRTWQGKTYALNEVSPYKYLKTNDISIYKSYIKNHEYIVDAYLHQYAIERSGTLEELWTPDHMDKVLESLKTHGYDPSKMCICVDENNIILDGQHRACCLLYLHGKDYVIDVCRVKWDK